MLVYFCTVPIPTSIPWRLWHYVMLLRAGTINHVAVGDAHEVVSMSFSGAHVMGDRAFRRLYSRTIVAVVNIPDISSRCPRPERYPVFRVLFRELAPRVHANDCVGIVADTLRRAGLAVPHVTTPRDLLGWLITEDYDVQTTL